MSSSAPGWRADLSFSDRFSAIQTMSIAIASSQSISPAQAHQEAKDIEAKLYESAVDRTTYDQGCQLYSERNNNKGSSKHQPTEESDSDSASEDTTTIGQYHEARHHKDGLFSFIFKARASLETHKTNDSPGQVDYVALKVTTPSLMSPPHNSAREVRILQATRCPHIIQLLDFFQHSGGRLVLVFPFLRYDLQTLLQRNTLTQEQVKSHMREMMRGLEFLHSKGIIHRDVKPSNILLKSRTGPAYLADFGIAWSPTDEASEASDDKITDVGTTSYRPPEILFGNKSYGCELDLWAAGCVIAEAASLSTTPLFDAGDLGSELALIQSIFKALGTANLEVWPEAKSFPDWGKMEFHEYLPRPWNQILPDAPPEARDLVGAMVKYESSQRLTAVEATKHPYLKVASAQDSD